MCVWYGFPPQPTDKILPHAKASVKYVLRLGIFRSNNSNKKNSSEPQLRTVPFQAM